MKIQLSKELTRNVDIDYPPILYKYRDWNNEYHKKILSENKIYLSSPKEFEDNRDCNVPEKFPHKAELKNFFSSYSKNFNTNYTRREHRAFARKWAKKSPLANPKMLERLLNEYNEEFNNRFGVLSLTDDPLNSEMWEKYGNKSTGICIGFNSEKLFSIVGGGGPVQYVEELPKINFMLDDFETQHAKNIFHKESKWSFEKEYRLHKMWENNASIEERNILMPPDCISEIILGQLISQQHQEEIIEAVRLNHPKVTIKTADGTILPL